MSRIISWYQYEKIDLRHAGHHHYYKEKAPLFVECYATMLELAEKGLGGWREQNGFKLDVLVELKPIEHIPLTSLASVGQGKWGEKKGEKVTISPELTRTVVSGSDCKTW